MRKRLPPRKPEPVGLPPIPKAPPRVNAPPVPPRPELPKRGQFLWTCRAGFEEHLYEELAWANAEPRILGEALVQSDKVKLSPAFARVGFEVDEVCRSGEVERLAEAVVRALPDEAVHVQVWSLDTDRGHKLTSHVDALAAEIAVQRKARGRRDIADLKFAKSRGVTLAQVCLLDAGEAAVGTVEPVNALSAAPGGRDRMRRDRDDPSRAALKLEEALEWLGTEPGGGDTCVDLGAAPGGWTQRLVARGARVFAVDPASLTAELSENPRVRHIRKSAFDFTPEEPVEWLFCDMAWRPIEVAQLLGKWARYRAADTLVANIKLPMNDKNTVLVRVRHELITGGWKNLQVRQLYHDRDEVTVTARLVHG